MSTGPTESDGQDSSFSELSVSGLQAPQSLPTSKGDAYAPPMIERAQSTVDSLDTAVEFVLALEHPCMNHIPHPVGGTGCEDPSDHIMLVCHSLRYSHNIFHKHKSTQSFARFFHVTCLQSCTAPTVLYQGESIKRAIVRPRVASWALVYLISTTFLHTAYPLIQPLDP